MNYLVDWSVPLTSSEGISDNDDDDDDDALALETPVWVKVF